MSDLFELILFFSLLFEAMEQCDIEYIAIKRTKK